MRMQSNDTYNANSNVNINKSGLRQPKEAQGGASKEFVTRLERYRQHLTSVDLQVGPALARVVEGFVTKGEEGEKARVKWQKRFQPLVTGILDSEKRWFYHVCKAHESAEESLSENEALFLRHEELRKAHPSAQTNYNRLIKQQQTIQSWRPSQAKWTNLNRLKGKIEKAGALSDEVAKLPTRYGDDYFEGLRLYLRGAGFIVAPSYLPPAAVFPREDWISLENNASKSPEDLASASDELMKKYHILGTSYSGLLYKYEKSESPKEISGCVCISWVKTTCISNKKHMLVPVLGMSGGAPKVKNLVGIEAMLGACALPPYKDPSSKFKKMFGSEPLILSKDSKSDTSPFNQYYDDIMARANNLAINYRVRELLSLRLPSRQAMLSYVGLSFFAASREQVNTLSSLGTPTPGVARWHSFNCAEPAALAWISSFFVDGQDVHLCCPYEGMDDPGALGLKPKETCPWCATVELAYRSLKKVPEIEREQWPSKFGKSMRTGVWAREFTNARQFSSKTDSEMRVDLPRNKLAFELAYPSAVNNNVAVLRKIFKSVGLLEGSTIREDQLALWQQQQ